MNPIDCRPKLISEMIRRYCRNESVVEDAVDEAISRLLRIELKSENVFPLLYQISKNILKDRKRGMLVVRRRMKILRNSVRRPATPLQNSMSLEFESSLKKELLSLRERERQAFELHYFDGLSYDEISLKMGISSANSKTIVWRARTALKDRLSRFSA